MGSRSVVIATALLWVSAFACEGDGGDGETGGGGAGAGGVCDSGLEENPDSVACVEASCCAEVMACADEPQCRMCYHVDAGNEEECDFDPPPGSLREAAYACRSASCP